MYLTAQRVQKLSTNERGVNVYYYRHSYEWSGDPPAEFLPDVNPGVLYNSWPQILPGGNAVISYLDVVVSDEYPLELLANHLSALKHVLSEQGNPTVATWRRMWIRFGTGRVPVPWQTELGALAAHVALRIA